MLLLTGDLRIFGKAIGEDPASQAKTQLKFGLIKADVIGLFPPACQDIIARSGLHLYYVLNLVRVTKFIFHTLHTEECVRKHSPWIF